MVKRSAEQWHHFDRDGSEERRLENRERWRERIGTIPRLPNGQLWPAPEYRDKFFSLGFCWLFGYNVADTITERPTKESEERHGHQPRPPTPYY